MMASFFLPQAITSDVHYLTQSKSADIYDLLHLTHLLLHFLVVLVRFEQTAYTVLKGSAFNICLIADHPSTDVPFSVKVVPLSVGARGKIYVGEEVCIGKWARESERYLARREMLQNCMWGS